MEQGAFGRAAQDRAAAEVEAEIHRLCERLAEGQAMGLDEGREMVGGAMAEFLTDFFEAVHARGARPGLRGMVALPMLVHGAETGDPEPARPLAAVHLLWWAAARYLDDLTGAPSPGNAATVKRVLTALAVGGHLPVRLVADLPVPDSVRCGLAGEVSRAWLDAVDGRLRDLTDRPSAATPASVLRAYAGRTGAPYAMAAASAARLAGAGGDRAGGWRAFGRRLGVLRRLVDDQRDLASGRYEDFANGTATYLLAHLLAALPAGRRREALALHAGARHSACARAELTAWMLDEDVLDGYAASVAPLVGHAHDLLGLLGGDPAFVRGLHGLVDETADRLPRLRPAVA
ncbi:hypothetical protein [Actinomadura opuntiae]|uniref:hypothetical protein n=1 Tax=Actinomadura sp. OS1-43 TaxID=604315 RepID=UPI00255AC597|nr:hypothetical protein [Actinomadura sp. OS1-43]MDL4820517.1 hypothetical protein [Actinomadura sp. OS1-43]